jgi:predicted dehydrogenase
MNRVKVGLIGTGFVADLHVAAVKMIPEVEVVGVASPAPGKARHSATERGIDNAFEDYRELLK